MAQKNDLKFTNDKIRDGSWGIYNNLEIAPEERWDPFRTICYNSKTLIGHRIVISEIRDNKPYEYQLLWNDIDPKQLKKGDDSFCQLIVGKIPSIVISKDLVLNKDPLSSNSSFENLNDINVFSAINLFPPMARIIAPKEKRLSKKKKIAKGIPIVHSFTKHYTTIEEIPEKDLVLFIKNIIMTLKTCERVLYSTGNEYINVFHFYNIGLHAGASIPHLHSQTLLQTGNKGYGWKNYSFIKTYEKHKRIMNDESYCLACEHTRYIKIDPFLNQRLQIKNRLIFENKHWMLFTAYAPERDSQLRLIPKRHVSALWNLNVEEINSLGKVLILANRLLTLFIQRYGKKLFIYQDRNILFRQQHFGYPSEPHMLIDIIPVQKIGGVEMLDDFRLSHVFPEDIANFLKQLNKKIY